MANFYQSTIMPDARFGSTKRVSDIALLEPVTRQSVEDVVADAKAMGIKLMVFETYRSQARQTDLFNQGASKLKQVGVHHFGLACDLVKDVGGQPSWDGDFKFLGVLARKRGLLWGGDWGDPGKPHTFVDAVHVQRCSLAKQPELFAKSWYPDDAYDPYA